MAGHVDAAYWQERLSELRLRHGVPGAVLGILRQGRIADVGSGVLSTRTRVPVTPDSVFQIGSITKVWTATLIMQLIDEGRLALDTPVAEVVPGFRLADPEATRAITVRHLLTHTSGIAGDVFADTGRGDDCVGTYVAGLDAEDFAQVHEAGATYSYSNSGYVVAGRIVEVLTGQSWDAALRTRLIEPLGLAATVTLPEEAILHRAAVGHGAGSEPTPVSTWVLPRCMGPAGLITARVHDLLVFARMHLDGGRAPGGGQVLSATAVRAMAERQVDLPDPVSTVGTSRGLGWMRFSWNDRLLTGHNGGTIGQRAVLRAVPGQGFAVALLTNGGDGQALYQDLFAEVFDELTDITFPARFGPPDEPVHTRVGRHAGRYSNSGLCVEVLERDGTAVFRTTATGSLAERARRLGEPAVEHYDLVPVCDGSFAVRAPRSRCWESVRCYALADGSRYLHWLGRAYVRTAGP